MFIRKKEKSAESTDFYNKNDCVFGYAGTLAQTNSKRTTVIQFTMSASWWIHTQLQFKSASVVLRPLSSHVLLDFPTIEDCNSDQNKTLLVSSQTKSLDEFFSTLFTVWVASPQATIVTEIEITYVILAGLDCGCRCGWFCLASGSKQNCSRTMSEDRAERKE